MYSASIVEDHIIYALKILFGEVGAALPFQVVLFLFIFFNFLQF